MGDSHRSVDRGLWQINDYWHPECSDSCAYDCSCNAGCAVSVWQSSGWAAWATYKNGLHQKYMNDAAVACGYSAEEQALESSVQVGYNPSAAVQWADANCATDDGTECAEFASNAIKAGGHANGCFYTWVPDLDNCLKNNAGWKQTSFPCSKGSVVIWYDGQGPYHAAISRGDGTIDQHNPNRCQTSGSWGSNYCLSPPSFTETETAEQAPLSVEVGISMSQIASYWKSAHSKDNCQTAVAVAMAESRGDCNAQYVNGPGSIDRGLWQINSKYHPECSDSCAYSCSCNAGCAVNVWKSSGWNAWNTYKNGLHKQYLNDAAVACGYTAEDMLGSNMTLV